MLSPKARKRARDSCGNLVTLTLNSQLAVRLSASVAVHLTVVDRPGSIDPDSGEHTR